MALDGFWIVQFEGVQGGGGGVAVLTKGQVFGGDSAYTYLGTYQTEEAALKAHVVVKNFLPGIPNVLGVVGDFELSLTGTVEGTIIKGKAALVGQSGAGIVVRLTKQGELP
jgi:type III secretion system (T3SS) negative regulator GrlR